ncbi:CinA family nicotinamide mononucleotide deamidase-related protein [Vibrio mediterranei]|uniref:CinA family nicotinamide mononucleotide deamidase-related protein n=1 Tax=Vibrio barjaei TaxID=1676683 RepID=UPI0007BBE495|nr:CinA family nicotinamide mononucleotide deamidase-related protein [Vibrio barjaei]MCG9786604.1 CinA family nicotinamide mononucleotide deamidase-related protein [Vibrio mediterranei]OIN27773.1 competence/damage-inducible protein A [Vibrio barjaei]
MPKIAMLSTGEEVLYGDIVDTNAAWLSRVFYEHGFSMSKRSTVGDQRAALLQEMIMLSLNLDVVIVNGGLGPTSDDLTAEVAAEAADQSLVLNQGWLETLRAFYAQRGKSMPDSNIKQAMLPKGAVVVDNPIGTACGFKMMINDCLFYFTPGVPSEFKKMTLEQILPDLKREFPNQQGRVCRRLYTFGLSESGIADTLSSLNLPLEYELGYRSYLPFIEVKLFGPSDDLEIGSRVLSMVEKLLHSNVVSVDQPMLDRIGHLVELHKPTIAISEHSTKGYLASWLQDNEQIEQYCGATWVLGSKTASPLDRDSERLGATLALAGATKSNCSSDIALSTGKLEDGEFSVALSTPKGEWGQTLKLQRSYNAQSIKTVISTVAGDMLRRYLDNKPMFPDYGFLTRTDEIFLPADQLK